VKKLNPNDTELEQVFEEFIDRYGYEEKNRLLFFFSGHGFTRPVGVRGYLIPKNAPLPQENESELFRKALSMSQIKTWCREMMAKHILFLFDSCFSGTIFTTKGEGDSLHHITDLTAKPVRQFITAGSAGEKVPARSVFTPFFVKAIQGEADLLKDGYITGTEIGLYLQKNVKQYSSTKQSPQCGKISDPEYIEGDFVFVSPLGGRIQFLRSTPDMLSESEAIRAIINHNFFDTEMNAIGKGYDNLYEVQIIRGDRVVIDHNSGLMWQQRGSSKEMFYEDAKRWVDQLNFAGFSDWRLPTLEEAMSLMESEKNSNGLYIDSKFDWRQRDIWTSDLRRASWGGFQWVVYFEAGDCSYEFSEYNYVRAVRSVQSSPVRKPAYTPPPLRNIPLLRGLSNNNVTAILKEKNLFD
ncbi:MAG: DUF1566 domain-containing protein, partial [Candidatus Aminicenantes bacterium]|nr:DUF1566 domain-containing protein [Candidatus Aminicenantes bacterium]NIT22057.1 DUF1566 domain-containing protein [Candidatus Aminicenantes bacterium]